MTMFLDALKHSITGPDSGYSWNTWMEVVSLPLLKKGKAISQSQ
jgi:hypothetical protein